MLVGSMEANNLCQKGLTATEMSTAAHQELHLYNLWEMVCTQENPSSLNFI